MSATTTILSFTDTDGNSQKIASVYVEKVIDEGVYRVINTSLPTRKYRATDSIETIKVEAGGLFSATESGTDILLNSLLIQRLFEQSNRCGILFQGGGKTLVDETVAVIEARIDSVNGNRPTSSPTPPTTLDSATYYNLTTAGTYTIEDAANTYDASDVFQMTLYNSSGGICTFNREENTVFDFLGDQLTTFDLLDGEEVTLTAVSTTIYNIG